MFAVRRRRRLSSVSVVAQQGNCSEYTDCESEYLFSEELLFGGLSTPTSDRTFHGDFDSLVELPVRVREISFMVDTRGHSNLGPTVVFEVLELPTLELLKLIHS